MTESVEPRSVTRATTVRLIALLDGHKIGHVLQDRNGQFVFVYMDEWRERQDAYPLSLSMPLTAAQHSHDPINAYLWGLLPDNSRTLDHYGRLFGVSPRNPAALLAHIGADCAGAVQFAPPDTIDSLLTAIATPQVEWLTEDQVASELRTVRAHGIPGTDAATVGQFSLAGAQPKIALLEEDGRWGRPMGRTPTNTILKPPSPEFHGFAENEHFCLELANALGLAAVRSRVRRFHDEIAIVVSRFDRDKLGDVYRRIHQEDVCQALGVMPTRKYENDGGPGAQEIIRLLRDSSHKPLDDVERFVSALALNWIIAGTDGHAKNYALLHAAGGATRLAPFYDIASYLPYAEAPLHRVKLAMKVGSQYLVRKIDRSHWEGLAKSISVQPATLTQQIEGIVEAVATTVPAIRDGAIEEGLDPATIQLLADRVLDRTEDCLAAMGRSTSPKRADPKAYGS